VEESARTIKNIFWIFKAEKKIKSPGKNCWNHRTVILVGTGYFTANGRKLAEGEGKGSKNYLSSRLTPQTLKDVRPLIEGGVN